MPPHNPKHIIGCDPIKISETDCVVQISTDANTVGTCAGNGTTLLDPACPPPGSHATMKRLAAKRPLYLTQPDACTVCVNSTASVVSNCAGEGEPLAKSDSSEIVEVKRLRATGAVLESTPCAVNIRSQLACTQQFEPIGNFENKRVAPVLNPENPGAGEKYTVRRLATGPGLHLTATDDHVCIAQSGQGGALPVAQCVNDYMTYDEGWKNGGASVVIQCNASATGDPNDTLAVVIGNNTKAPTNSVNVGHDSGQGFPLNSAPTNFENITTVGGNNELGFSGDVTLGSNLKSNVEEIPSKPSVSIGNNINNLNGVAIGTGSSGGSTVQGNKTGIHLGAGFSDQFPNHDSTTIGHNLATGMYDTQTFMRTLRPVQHAPPGYITQKANQELVFVPRDLGGFFPTKNTVEVSLKANFFDRISPGDDQIQRIETLDTGQLTYCTLPSADPIQAWASFSLKVQWRNPIVEMALNGFLFLEFPEELKSYTFTTSAVDVRGVYTDIAIPVWSLFRLPFPEPNVCFLTPVQNIDLFNGYTINSSGEITITGQMCVQRTKLIGGEITQDDAMFSLPDPFTTTTDKMSLILIGLGGSAAGGGGGGAQVVYVNDTHVGTGAVLSFEATEEKITVKRGTDVFMECFNGQSATSAGAGMGGHGTPVVPPGAVVINGGDGAPGIPGAGGGGAGGGDAGYPDGGDGTTGGGGGASHNWVPGDGGGIWYGVPSGTSFNLLATINSGGTQANVNGAPGNHGYNLGSSILYGGGSSNPKQGRSPGFVGLLYSSL